MKNKRNTGLRAGIYRETQSTCSQTLLELLSALLIFLAFAAIGYTISGFAAMLWLLGAGALTCIAAAAIRHFKKMKLMLPILLAALLLVVLFARNPLLNGFGAAWNTLRDLWAAEKGILLPLAETDGTGLWLAGIVAGLLLAMMSVALSRVPTLTAVLMAALSVAAAFVQPGVLLLAAAAIALLMLTWQKNKNAVSAASFLLVGVIVAGVAAISLQTGTMQSLSENAKSALHYWRYEKADKVLPEGDLTKPVPSSDETEPILSVTSDKADTLYLRGFVGDTYKNGTWSALDPETAAAEKDLFYWLHENGFYPQSQFTLSAIQTAEHETETIQISNLSACSLYRYEPFSVLPTSAGTAKNRLAPSAVKASGWNGEREYSYTVIANSSAILPEILDELQQNEANDAYLQTESAYRDFVDSYALAVPQEFTGELGALLEETRKNLNFSGELSKEQAQLCALSFLETCFGGDTSLPLDSTAKGTTYQYATVAALALRYYGIPARYVEGFTVKTAENENVSVTDENAGAWVEVYQDGVGWLPLALTPGLESLAPEQTESGIKPVGAGEGEGSGPRVTEGQEPEQDDAEQSEDPDNTPDGGQRTGLLQKPAFWILLVVGILLLFVLFILIRHHIILKNRQKTFDDPDNSEAISSLFSDAAKLLSALGFDRRGGSMLALYDPISGQFGEETANTFRTMVFLNEKALFSSKTPDDPEREAMRNFHGTVLNLLKTSTKWPRKLRLKWLNCLY